MIRTPRQRMPPSARPRAPPLPQAQPGFEERIGTRWVVWVGGLTLALGGFFMVRYSIDAGLLGPGVRTLLGGAFALALLAAGEWTRRKESISAIEALPIANIPAILTAAGTAVAFATVYAAYALYDFLAPATAFILLGLVALGTLAAALLHGPALAGLGIAAAFVTPILVSSEQAGLLGALHLSRRSSPRRRSGWRGSGCGAGSRSPPSCSRCSGPSPACNAARRWSDRTRSTSSPGFVLAALLVVCGFMFGPPADEGRIEPISSGSLAAYLLGATADRARQFPCRRRHDRCSRSWWPARCSWRGARRPPPARSAPPPCSSAIVFARMGGARQSGHAGAAGRTVAGHRPRRHRRFGLVASDHRGDLRRRLRRRRFPGAGPLGQRHHPGGVVGGRRCSRRWRC